MKKTTSSLFAATAALGLIAASAGVAFAAETPTAPEPSAPATEAPAPEPSAPAAEDPAPEPSAPVTEEPAPEPSTPGDNNTGGSAETPTPADDSSAPAPAADQGGAGAASGPVGNAGVSTRPDRDRQWPGPRFRSWRHPQHERSGFVRRPGWGCPDPGEHRFRRFDRRWRWRHRSGWWRDSRGRSQASLRRPRLTSTAGPLVSSGPAFCLVCADRR